MHLKNVASMRISLSLVAVSPLAVLGATSAHAWVTFPGSSFTVKEGSTTVASGSTTGVKHGWYEFAGRHYSSANFNVRDRKTTDGHSAFGDVVTSIDYLYCRPFFGGHCVSEVRSKTAGATTGTRTTSSWSGTLSATWEPQPFLGVYSKYSVCIDKRLAPDKCQRVTRYSSYGNYIK